MKEIERFVVGSDVTSLEDGLFKDLPTLREVDFANCDASLQIPKECFKGCIELRQCIYPGCSEAPTATSQQKICVSTFQACQNLTKLVMPTSISEIEENAFQGCKSLLSIDIGNSTTSVDQAAFAECESLQRINGGSGLKVIETSAFSNCTQLTSFGRFASADKTQTFNVVGEYAFANTRLKKANLSLSSTPNSTWWGDYCFASCDNLEEVKFYNSIYLGSHMFEKCINLKKVEFDAGQNNYVGKYVFNGCSSLTSMSFSKKQFSFLEGMFKDCTSLKKIGFDGYDDGEFQFVQKNAFAGCSKLTSIEFPDSLNSLTKLDDACLSNCALTSINFHGIPADELFKVNEGIDNELLYGKIYEIELVAGRPMFNEYTKYNSINEFNKIWNVAKENKLDICIICDRQWYDNIMGCWNGERLNYQSQTVSQYPYTDQLEAISKNKKAIFIRLTDWLGYDEYGDMEPQQRLYTDAEILDFLKDAANIRKKLLGDKDYENDCLTYVSSILKNAAMRNFCLDKTATPFIYMLYFTNGDYQHVMSQRISGPAETIRTQFDTVVSKNFDKLREDYEVAVNKYECINDTLLSTGFFRLNHNCLVYTSDRQRDPCKFVYDSSKVIPYRPSYEYASDMTTKKDFKMPYQLCKGYKNMKAAHQAGKNPWYYNAIEVVQQAVDQHQPVLLMFSLETCSPCQWFKANLHENDAFQDWYMKQKFLLCRIEATKPKGYDQQLAYCEDVFSRAADNYISTKGSKVKSYNGFGETTADNYLKGHFSDMFAVSDYPFALTPPCLMFYWKDSNGKVIANHAYSLHNLLLLIDKEKMGEDLVLDSADFIQLIKSLCLYHFEGNDLAAPNGIVHDAGKIFNKFDYQCDKSNRWKVAENLIDLNFSNLDTIAKVKTYMADALTQHDHADGVVSGEIYIQGCYTEAIDWLEATFGALYFKDDKTGYDQVTQILDAWFIKVGNDYYKMGFDFTKKKKGNTCFENSYIYKVVFTKTPYVPPLPKLQLTVTKRVRDQQPYSTETMYFQQMAKAQAIKVDIPEADYDLYEYQISDSNVTVTKPTPGQKLELTLNIPANYDQDLALEIIFSGDC